MDPWLEGFWRDVHASLLVYARDQLNGELPPDLSASVDGRGPPECGAFRRGRAAPRLQHEPDPIRIPLRRGERDAALDLQLLVDQCYERGRYGRKIDYSKAPEPPLPAEDLAWTRDVLGAAAGAAPPW